MGKILGNMWRNVDEETKKKYEVRKSWKIIIFIVSKRKAEKAKEMYAVEMEEYWKAMEAFQVRKLLYPLFYYLKLRRN